MFGETNNREGKCLDTGSRNNAGRYCVHEDKDIEILLRNVIYHGCNVGVTTNGDCLPRCGSTSKSF